MLLRNWGKERASTSLSLTNQLHSTQSQESRKAKHTVNNKQKRAALKNAALLLIKTT